jgi:glycosyl transferase family 25
MTDKTLQNYLCLVINLDRSPHRLDSIRAQLDAAGIAFERLPALEGRALSPEQLALVDVPTYRRSHGKEPTAGEMGCYLSHLAAMRTFLASGHAHCLVLEDDAQVPPQAGAAMQSLVAQAAHWDMAMLYGNHAAQAVTTAELGSGQRLVGFFGKQTGAVAYALNRPAAQAYVQHLMPMRLPIDHAFGEAWHWGLRIRGVNPFPIGCHHELGSDIGKTGRKFPWYRRLGAYRLRLASDLRRIGYHLLRDPIWLEAVLHRWRGR